MKKRIVTLLLTLLTVLMLLPTGGDGSGVHRCGDHAGDQP